MDEPVINADLMFRTVHIREEPPRWDGNTMTYRYRCIECDRHGNVLKDEMHDGGSIRWDETPPSTLWQRIKKLLC